MQSSRAIFGSVLVTALGLVLTVNLVAQDKTAAPKRLAKGVLKTIPLEMQPRDMYSTPMPSPGVDAKQFTPKTIPNEKTLHGMSKSVIMFREYVYQYEYAFTGLRQAKLKVPSVGGGVTNKNFWYIVYRIRDTGKTYTFDKEKTNEDLDQITYNLKEDQPIEASKKVLTPRFTLEGSVPTAKGYQRVAYRDQINPIVVEQIRMREDPNQRLLDGLQMSRVKIPPAKNDSDPGVWGVAVWEDVNPDLDYVSVYVKGLTNAFRLSKNVDEPSKLKTLQLNFWRAGDSVAEERDDIAFGIPFVDDSRRQVLICKQYNLPGPIFRVYHANKDARRDVLVAEADGQVSLKDFKSALAPTLDQGKLPNELAKAIANSGVQVDPGAALTTVLEGKKWTFQEGSENYTIILEPQFWEADFEGIRFIKSLDYMWIYR
ncbi:MAG: hypothetical protein AB8B55_16440 [Mariniblastus sp.]